MKKLNTYISDEKISSLDEYINEKLKIGKSGKTQYTCQPKDKYELRKILEERLAKDKDVNLNDIDVSEITDMNSLFEDLDPYNIDISAWDVSSVIDMDYMFYYCEKFNCNLSDWDVTNVKYMNYMFYGCKNLDCDLSDWDVSNAYKVNMFAGCDSLKNKPSWYKE